MHVNSDTDIQEVDLQRPRFSVHAKYSTRRNSSRAPLVKGIQYMGVAIVGKYHT